MWRKYGDTKKALSVESDIAIPEITKDNQVLVKIEYASLHPGDDHIMRPLMFPIRFMFGLFSPKNRVFGMNGSGIVHKVGVSVTEYKVGDKVFSGDQAEIRTGNSLPIKLIPEGTLVHNIELRCGKGGQMARSAGASAQLMAKEGSYATFKLSSGEVRLVQINCRATIGVVGNSEHANVSYGKAGRTRWIGRRPRVRAVAMNPVDHPMGGGEGRSSGGRHPCSPWGQPAKGFKTRSPRKSSNKFILSRRKKRNKR